MTTNKSFKKAKNNPGKPEQISQEIVDKICKAMSVGCYIETAAAVSGVSKQTLYAWMKKGHKMPKSIYGRFLDAVDKALETAAFRDLLVIDRAANGQEWEYERHPDGSLMLKPNGNPIVKKIGLPSDWKASAWRLERKFSKQWGSSQKIEHSGSIDQPKKIITEIDKAALAKALEEIENDV